MKKLIFIFTFILATSVAFSQSIDRQVISSTGGYSEAGNISVSYTVGEPMVETFEAGTIVLTQGFQQPDASPVGMEDINSGISILAYPNPTEGEIILDFTTTREMELSIGLMDVLGKQVSVTENISVSTGTKHLMDLSALASGNYFIVLKSADGTMNTNIKVQKID